MVINLFIGSLIPEIYSPDLNPIEELFSAVKYSMKVELYQIQNMKT